MLKHLNPLSANFTKWSNTLKQLVGKLRTNCLSVFDHFVGLAFKGLKDWNIYSEPCQTSKLELFAKIVNGVQPLTIFAKIFIIDVSEWVLNAPVQIYAFCRENWVFPYFLFWKIHIFSAGLLRFTKEIFKECLFLFWLSCLSIFISINIWPKSYLLLTETVLFLQSLMTRETTISDEFGCP